MQPITSYDALVERLLQDPQRKRVAVVWPADECTITAISRAAQRGFAHIVAVGNRADLESKLAALSPFIDYVEASTPDDAARQAVALVRDKQADVLMKGLVSTDVLLHAVLDKQCGLMPTEGAVLSHIAVAEVPALQRLLTFTDAAVIPYPTHEQRVRQVHYAVNVCRRLGIDTPRVALIHCSEKPNQKYFPFTMGYADIIAQAKAGQFGQCIVDGPLDVKTSCDSHSLETKGIASPLAGRADALIMPDIEAGNVFYKTLSFFGGALLGGILQGPTVPVVVSSRADNADSKFASIALAAINA